MPITWLTTIWYVNEIQIIFNYYVIKNCLSKAILLLEFLIFSGPTYFHGNNRQVLDLVPTISRLYFMERIPATLSYGQAAILLCLGVQHQNINYVEVSSFLFLFVSCRFFC